MYIRLKQRYCEAQTCLCDTGNPEWRGKVLGVAREGIGGGERKYVGGETRVCTSGPVYQRPRVTSSLSPGRRLEEDD